MPATVTITTDGRDGRIRFTDGPHEIWGCWEFGGGDVVAIVQMGSRGEWERSSSWAMDQRTAILHFVAEEVVRQRAPAGTVDIDEDRGVILLRQGTGGAAPGPVAKGTRTPHANSAAFVRRNSKIKAMFALGVLGVALIVGAMYWTGKKLLTVAQASGVPMGECVRTSTHIASLIQSTDPHLPEVSGRGGNTTGSISILLVPLDGSGPYVVPVVGGLTGGSYNLARIMGSDGHTLWLDAAGLYGVRLSDHELITPEHLLKANPSLDPSWWEDPRGMDMVDGKLHVMRIDHRAAIEVDPSTWKTTAVEPRPSNTRFDRHGPSEHMVAGFIAAPSTWLGLHSTSELEGPFKPGKWVRPVESADDTKQLRRLCKAGLEPGYDGAHHCIQSIAAVNDTEYLNAAFLRMGAKSEPLRLRDPDGALMVHTSAPGLNGTLVVSRVDLDGNVRWSVDTGLDRFMLQQILPGDRSFAFVGTRLPVPDKVSEPLLVIVDNNTGKLTTHSLWR